MNHTKCWPLEKKYFRERAQWKYNSGPVSESREIHRNPARRRLVIHLFTSQLRYARTTAAMKKSELISSLIFYLTDDQSQHRSPIFNFDKPNNSYHAEFLIFAPKLIISIVHFSHVAPQCRACLIARMRSFLSFFFFK